MLDWLFLLVLICVINYNLLKTMSKKTKKQKQKEIRKIARQKNVQKDKMKKRLLLCVKVLGVFFLLCFLVRLYHPSFILTRCGSHTKGIIYNRGKGLGKRGAAFYFFAYSYYVDGEKYDNSFHYLIKESKDIHINDTVDVYYIPFAPSVSCADIN